MLTQDKIIILGLVGIFFYSIHISRPSSSQNENSNIQHTQIHNKRQPSDSKTLNSQNSSPTTSQDASLHNTINDEDVLDPSYLEFAAQRDAYQNQNNEGAIDAGANPYSQNTLDLSHLKEGDIEDMQTQELAQREENFATEEMDWDEYTHQNSISDEE